MTGEEKNPARHRGRPRGGGASHVHDDLIAAMRTCLATKSHVEITLKEVAEQAGTSPEMVRYYFGGKDGLVTALLRDSVRRFATGLLELEKDILVRDGNPTRHLIGTLHRLYMEAQPSSRISSHEFLRQDSGIRQDFLNGQAEVVIAGVHRIVVKLIDAGLYAPGLDPRNISVTVMTMVSGPVLLLASLPPSWVSTDKLSDPAWIDHLTVCADRMCRPAA